MEVARKEKLNEKKKAQKKAKKLKEVCNLSFRIEFNSQLNLLG